MSRLRRRVVSRSRQQLSFLAPKDGLVTVFWEKQRMGWVAASDIAAFAAKVQIEGPRKHHRRNYWMSTEALDGSDVAAILSEVTGRNIKSKMQGADDAKALFESLMEYLYSKSCVELMRHVADG
jgi:NAD(P)H dehydrogenase (quinone)